MHSARFCTFRVRLFVALLALGVPLTATAQTTYHVSDDVSLANAISSVISGDTIVFDNNITLSSTSLPTLYQDVTIDGNYFVLSGNNQFSGLTTSSNDGIPVSITVQNLTIQNTVATGGAGQNGTAGGGGGAGLGGAIYVGSEVTLTVSNVNIQSSSAFGGAGGIANGGAVGGNGGGLNGGYGGGTGGSFFDGGPGSFGGGGGGAGPVGASGGTGGTGGFGGGAGGSTSGVAVYGGFAGGGNNGTTSGGGGAGLGGAMFVESGGILQINGGFSVNGNTVAGGAGGGAAYGSGLFLDGSGTLGVSTGTTVTINDSIADGFGSGNSLTGGSWGIYKNGSGTLVLGGKNNYTGGTSIYGGTVSVSSSANIGSGSVTILNGGTLAITGSDGFANRADILQLATFRVSPAQIATWNGAISDSFDSSFVGTLNVTGGGTLVLGNARNSYRGGTIVSGNSTVSIADDHALGAPGTTVTLGDPSSWGRLSITTPGAFASSRAFSLQAGGGIIDTSASTTATLSGVISGAGGLTKQGGGSLLLTGTNSYFGKTTVDNGTLIAGGSGVFGSAPALVINAMGNVDFGGYSQSIQTLSGTGGLQLSGGANLTFGVTNASSAFGGTISGSGGIVKVGSGTLTLSGPNSFAGGILVNAGGLSVGADTNLGGGGSVALADQTTLALTGSDTFTHTLLLAGRPLTTVGGGTTATWNGLIGDQRTSGALQVTGGGTFALGNASNSYSGGTFASGGSTILVGADGALGAAGTGVSLGDQTSTATLAINGGSFLTSRTITIGSPGATINTFGGTNATLAGSINGAGSITKTGSGTLTLSGANGYSGTTFAQGGTLKAGRTNVFGASGNVAIGSGATVDLNGFNQALGGLSGTGTMALGAGATLTLGGNGSNVVFGGAMIGSGSLVKDGRGVLTLSGTSSYTGGTTVNDGTLLGTAASIQGNILNRANVVFEQTGTGTYSGNMSGSGALFKTGSGSLVLGGTNTYSGGTLVSAGTLIGNTSSLQGTIVNNAALVFDQAGNGTFNGTIVGAGTVSKIGFGTATFNGANAFTGLLTVGQGTLNLNGGFAGDVNVLSQGTLRAAGIVGGSLNVDGTLSVPPPTAAAASFAAMGLHLNATAGTSVPSIFVSGNLTTTAGSVLDFTVTPSGIAPIVVGGLANISNSHLNITVSDPNPARNATYVGVSSGGLTVRGVDAGSTDPLIIPVLKYDTRSLYITVLNENVPLSGVTTVTNSPNAAAPAAAIDRIKKGATGDLAFVIRELTALDDNALNGALRGLSGELHATETRMAVDESQSMADLVRDVVGDRANDEPARQASGLDSMRFWFQLTGDHASFSPVGYDSAIANTGGGGGGFDFRLGKRLILGGGGSFSRAGLSMGGLGGSSDMQAPRAFGYGGYSLGPFGLFNGGGSTSRTSYVTRRPVTFAATIPTSTGQEPLSGGVNRQADAEQSGVTRDAWSEWKETYNRGSWSYNSKLGFRAATYSRDPFNETGAGAISLVGLAQELKTKEADINVHVYRRRGTWRPRIFMTYLRQLGDEATTSGLQIGDQPAGQFLVNGVPIPVDQFHGIFGLTMHSGSGLEYTFEYETRQAKDESHNAVHFRVRFK